MERCSKCDCGLLEFYHRYTEKPRELFDLCVDHKLILESKSCDTCGKPAILSFNLKLWRCQKTTRDPIQRKRRKCNWSESVFKNTFFASVHLDLETVLFFVNAYLRECFSYQFVRSEFGLRNTSICDSASFCGEVLIERCVKCEGKIGGPGKIVEIDESKFGKKYIYNVGRIVEG